MISVMAVMPSLPSAAMKLVGHPEVAKGMEHLGLPESIVTPLGILELACVVVYAIPQTTAIAGQLLKN